MRREFEGNDGNMSFSAGPCAEASGRGVADGRLDGISVFFLHLLGNRRAGPVVIVAVSEAAD